MFECGVDIKLLLSKDSKVGLRDHRPRARDGRWGGSGSHHRGHSSGIWPASPEIITVNKAAGRTPSMLPGLTSSNVRLTLQMDLLIMNKHLFNKL